MNVGAKQAFLLSNTIYFAQKFVRTIQDVIGFSFDLQPESFTLTPFTTKFPMMAISSFYGKITGMFVVAIDDDLIALLANCNDEPSINSNAQASSLLRELLNTAVSHSLMELESVFGGLTNIPPLGIHGSVEFPDFESSLIHITYKGGVAHCGLFLNMAIVKIAQQLEEAQNKLLKVATSQNAMLIRPEDLPAARFAYLYKSLDEAGGDMFDVLHLSEDVFSYFLADVAGHDISSGFVTASLKALVRQNCTSHFTPIECMRNINHVLCQVMTGFEYATASYIVLDRKESCLEYISMGHPPVLLVRSEGGSELLESESDVLGAYRKPFISSIKREIKTGDRIVMITDGLLERTGKSVWSQEVSSLLEISDMIRSLPFHNLPQMIYDHFFLSGLKPIDDVVILTIEV